jgi:hypothetical protein
MNSDIKKFAFGTCAFAKTNPKPLKADTLVINVIIPFEEALKLNLAIDEGVRKLNKYKMSTMTGKRAALNLSIHVGAKRVAVSEAKLNEKDLAE